MKYSIITFGCRVNQADSQSIEESLRARGGQAVEPDTADLVVVNTCSVTASADQGARQTIRRVNRQNPSARIVVTGCYATRRPEEVAALPGVIRLVPNDEKLQIVNMLAPELGITTADRFGAGEGSCGAAVEPGVAGRTAYTLRVQTGCDERCSYCIIPSTRGRGRSVPIDVVVAEVARAVRAGFKEIVLTGVHLGSYGRDLIPKSPLVELLRTLAQHQMAQTRARSTVEREIVSEQEPAAAAEREGAERPAPGVGPRREERRAPASDVRNDILFRISSLEPMDCTHEVVDLVAEHECFAPHWHLPLQHASDRMLRAMGRPYSAAYYAELVARIRERLPAAAIGSDVIVGFPGETDDDFDRLASHLESSPLTHVHVFPYSDRPGTVASGLGRKVHGAVVRERAGRVREIGHRLAMKFRQSQLGTTHRGLTLEDGTLVVTGNYLKVRIPPGHARNEWLRVRIEETAETLKGVVVAAGRQPNRKPAFTLPTP